MGNIAIRVEDISKAYRLVGTGHRPDSLGELVLGGFRSVSRPREKESVSPSSMFWALRNVSFEVQQGEVIGLVGRNGSGKSTLLKVLSRITEPTSGKAEVFGRIGSLLEIGTGFDRELSGRENIYLSGAILGMQRREIIKQFDEIVAFAEVEKFIDTPVKRYSSGMYLRLAFAVAAHLDTEILLVDEVLAVGDATFQRKCLSKMGAVAGKGKTVLFVSHNMAAMGRLCRLGVWLDGGEVQAYGNIDGVIAQYLHSGVHDSGEVIFPVDAASKISSESIRFKAVRIRSKNETMGWRNGSLDYRYPISIEIEYEILRQVSNLRIGATVVTQDGTMLLRSMDKDEGSEDVARMPGKYVSGFEVPANLLNYGQYFLSVLADSPGIQSHVSADRVLSFRIEQTGGFSGGIPDGRAGLLRMQLPWRMQKLG